jgi:hypothetical protein
MAPIDSFALRADAAGPVTGSEPVTWALGHLATALRAAGAAQTDSGAALTVDALDAASETARRKLRAAGIAMPDAAESFVLLRAGPRVIAIGADARGLVYALTELADRVRHADGALTETGFPLVEAPATAIRSICRAFVSEAEDKAWLHDRSHWIAYLDMLVGSRFNRFSLALGMGYDYPYHNHLITDVYLHFAYPYLLAVPGYDISVAELPDGERATNLDALRFIGREAARRGLDFQLGLWTQRYDFDDVPDANYTVLGVTRENLAPYCRDAIALLLREVPDITGLTFRIHVEGGISEGDYDFWRTAFSGVRQAGRPVLIDMHAKGLDDATLNLGLETGLPVCASPKYLAEHMGLSYHPSAIREREYPPAEAMTNREKLSVGSRRFLRQSYGDLLPAGKRWKVVFRVWPGTQRVLAWGDPELAAGYGRSATFAGADGIEWMEPMTFKGRQGTGMTGGRLGYRDAELTARYDWVKYQLQYRLWGRLSFSPDASPESWQRYLRWQCGDAAAAIETALSAASKILPLLTNSHGPSIANHNYWPEVYTNIPVLGDAHHRPFGDDMGAPIRFGNAPSFDSQLISTAREYAAALLAGEVPRCYTPMDVADWLQRCAETAEIAIAQAKSCDDCQRPAARRLLIDAGIAASLGRFFAAKFRAACWAELFLASHRREAKVFMLQHLHRARDGWLGAAKLSEDIYPHDITFGPGPHLRGSWHSRYPSVERELRDARAFRFRDDDRPECGAHAALAAIERLAGRKPVQAGLSAPTAPERFTPCDAVAIGLPASAGDYVLHYRHVNQGERWQTMPMRTADGQATATIPGGYTDSPYHLQFYVSSISGDEVRLAPGFAASLANMPYCVIMQA